MMILIVVLSAIYMFQLLAVFISLVDEIGELPNYQFFKTKKKILFYLIPCYFLFPAVKVFVEMMNDLAQHIRGLE